MTVQQWIADTTDTTTIYASERIFDVHAHVHITRGQHGIVKTNSRNSCVSAVKPLVVTQHCTCVVTGRWQAAFMQQYSMQFVCHLNNKWLWAKFCVTILAHNYYGVTVTDGCHFLLLWHKRVTKFDFDKMHTSIRNTFRTHVLPRQKINWWDKSTEVCNFWPCNDHLK